MITTSLHRLLTTLLFIAATLFGTNAFAADKSQQIRFDETVHVGGDDLKLNGYGIRRKLIFNVYSAALYIKEKKTTVPDVLASSGARRVHLIMMRDVSNEDFGRGFITGIGQNNDRAEKAKWMNQFQRFGELFSSVPELKKGDVLHVDWIPAQGTVLSLNGKQLGEPYPDIAFYNALLKIWLGEKPVDDSLKKAMLGGKD